MTPLTGQVELALEPGWLRMPPGLGEHAPGVRLPIAPLVRRLVDRLDEAGLVWAVLRNADGLPDFTRYDLDLLALPRQRAAFLEILEVAAVETGWRIAGRIHKRHYDGLLLARGAVAADLFFLPIDLFTALEYRGLRYLDAETVLNSRIRNRAGFWILPPGLEAAITLLKEWLPHGVLKENSCAAVQAQAAADPDRFRPALESALGAELAGRLAEAVCRGEWSLAASDRQALRREVRQRTPRWPLAVADAWLKNLAHLFRPAAGCVVCLAGADGSGKTTLARGLAERLYKRPFKACRYVHGNLGVLPRFRDLRAALRRLAGRPPAPAAEEPAVLKGMMTPLPAWKSAALATYYAVDLFLGRWLLRRWRSQWALVIMDRSFYDYYYQLGHRRCPARILDILARLIPKPDFLLSIEGDAAQIHARKPELTVEEIQAEQAILRGLAERLPFAYRLEGKAGTEAMIAAGRDRILNSLHGIEPDAAVPLCCWEWRGRPWLAYPAGPRAQRLRALDLFPRATGKRRMFHAAVRLAIALGVDSIFCSVRKSAGDLLARAELDGLLAEIGDRPQVWLLAWPARLDRQRMYLVFREASGRIGVVKIGAGDFNRRQFQNEAEALRRLGPGPHPFTVPAVRFLRDLPGGRAVLALGGFPPRLAPPSAAQAAHWSATVIAHLATLKLVHGDLGPGNMLRDDGGGLFLFDWENAATDAPAAVDEVGFWLSLRQSAVLRDPRGQAAALRREFSGVPEAELLGALEFLRARDNLAAARLREAWA